MAPRCSRGPGQPIGVSGADNLWVISEKTSIENDDRKGGSAEAIFFTEEFDGDDADQGCGCGVDQIVSQEDDTQGLSVRLSRGEGAAWAPRCPF